MGYRSEVRSLIYGSKEKLEAFITFNTLIQSSIVFTYFKENLSKYSIEELDIYVLDLELSHVKWYNDYDDVKAWNKLLEEAESDELQYEFIRIGEDHDDIEVNTSVEPLYLITTQTHIATSFIKGNEFKILGE